MEIEITDLIPQRAPIMMVDALLQANDEEATCMLTVREDNFFLETDGNMAEVGLIEHIAQSASAFAGYRAIADGATEPPVGYIGEVKNFHLYQRPQLGDTIVTTITMGPTVEGVTIIRGETKKKTGPNDAETIFANTTMKIFIDNDK